MTPQPSAATKALGMRPVQGEAPGEVVYLSTWGNMAFWIKHEYEGASWEWIVVDGRYPVDFGTEKTEEEAAARLDMAIRDLCPDYYKPKGLLSKVRELVGL